MSHASAIATLAQAQLLVVGRLSGIGGGRGRRHAQAARRARTRPASSTRELPDTYRIAAVRRSSAQAPPRRTALGRSGRGRGGPLGRRDLRTRRSARRRSPRSWSRGRATPDRANVVVHHYSDRAHLQFRRHRGVVVTGVEPTLVALAALARRRGARSRVRGRAPAAAHLDSGARGVPRSVRRAGRAGAARAPRAAARARSGARVAIDARGEDAAAPRRARADRLRARASRSTGTTAGTGSTSAFSPSARSSRPTAGGGTTTPPTTSTTTRSGACPAATASSWCSPRGRRSRAVRPRSWPISAPRSPL